MNPDQAYQKNDFYWGEDPDQVLLDHLSLVPIERALDIGCGQGRNSIFLAGQGFEVDAIDRCEIGIVSLRRIIQNQQIMNINAFVGDVLNFNGQGKNYCLVVAVNVFNFFGIMELHQIIKKLSTWTSMQAYLYITVFSDEDPMCLSLRRNLFAIEISKNTFTNFHTNLTMHFFNDQELIRMFRDWKYLYFENNTFEDEHGFSGKHEHSQLKMFAVKK